MPTSFNGHWVVETPTRKGGLGSSDTSALKKAFPSPVGEEGQLANDEAVLEHFRSNVIDGVVQDDGVYGRVDRDYQGRGDAPGAPNLEETETGGGGLPGTPYAPNIASPGEEQGHNPTGIPSEGTEATDAAKGSGEPFTGGGGDNLESPHDGTSRISKQTVGSLMLGDSEPTG